MAVSARIPVQLDGSASTDPDGDPITYAWSFAAMPAGSASAFDDHTSAQPRFTPDLAGDYAIDLIVSDGTDSSPADQIVITAGNNTATQTIGAAGGEIASSDGKVRLTVPAGALSSDEDIAVTFVPDGQRSSYLGPEFDGLENIASVYDFAPDGLTFITPATVTIATGLNPVIDADTIGGPIQFLLTSDGTVAEGLQELTISADANSASTEISGTLGHFSPVVWVTLNIDSEWRISGVPDRLLPREMVLVRASVESEFIELKEAFYFDRSFKPPFAPVFGDTAEPMIPQGDANEFALATEYHCLAQGAETFSASIAFETNKAEEKARSPIELLKVSATATKDVMCQENAPPPSARLTPGLRAAPSGLTQLDMFRIGKFSSQIELEGFEDQTDDPMLLLSGAQGHLWLNALTAEILLNGTDATRVDPAFGAVPASTITGGRVAGAIVDFGPGQLGGTSLRNYDADNKEFFLFRQTLPGTGYDVQWVGQTHETPQLTIATSRSVGVIEVNDATALYEFNMFPTATNAFLGQPRSAVRGGLSGPLLVLTQFSDIAQLQRVQPDGTITEDESFFGLEARKIRCIDLLCAFSLTDNATGGGALWFLTWDGQNAPAAADAPIPVGDSPVDFDGTAGVSGGYLWVSAGFFDNTLTVTETTSTGELIRSNTVSAPTGCDQPGSVQWFELNNDPDPVQRLQVAGTCYNSNQYFFLDIEFDEDFGHRIITF